MVVNFTLTPLRSLQINGYYYYYYYYNCRYTSDIIYPVKLIISSLCAHTCHPWLAVPFSHYISYIYIIILLLYMVYSGLVCNNITLRLGIFFFFFVLSRPFILSCLRLRRRRRGSFTLISILFYINPHALLHPSPPSPPQSPARIA